jgi:hypothetical protein
MCLPSFDFRIACKEILQVFVSAVRTGRDGLDHPVSELGMKVNFAFGVALVLQVELVYQIECLVSELHLMSGIVEMEQSVLELFAPMQVSSFSVLRFMGSMELQILQDAPLFVFLDEIFVLIVSHELAFDCEITHYYSRGALLYILPVY